MQDGHFGMLKRAIATWSGELQIELVVVVERCPVCTMSCISGQPQVISILKYAQHIGNTSQKNHDVFNVNFIHLKPRGSPDFTDRLGVGFCSDETLIALPGGIHPEPFSSSHNTQ